MADIRFGIKTGCNEFFYLTKEQAEEWQIEEEFLVPVLTSLRTCPNFAVTDKNINTLVFICRKTKMELKHTKALEYIKWGESEGFSTRQSVLGRRNWWELPPTDQFDFILMRFRDLRNWTPIIQSRFLIGDTVFVGKAKNKTEALNLNLLLNSTLLLLMSELYGRVGLGDGLLTTYGPDLKPMILLKPALISFEKFDKQKLLKRKVKSTFEECGIDPRSEVAIEEQEPKPLADRKELDDIVFDALNLTADERKDVYRAVCRLVWNRINKAQSV